MCLGPTRSAAEWESEARSLYPDAVRVIERIVRANHLCDDGKRIAWASARWIQEAVERGPSKTAPNGYNPVTVY